MRKTTGRAVLLVVAASREEVDIQLRTQGQEDTHRSILNHDIPMPPDTGAVPRILLSMDNTILNTSSLEDPMAANLEDPAKAMTTKDLIVNEKSFFHGGDLVAKIPHRFVHFFS